MKFTPWFPSTVKPYRPGVYQIMDIVPWYRYWDGKVWYGGGPTAESAFRGFRDRPIIWFPTNWRGLIEESK